MAGQTLGWKIFSGYTNICLVKGGATRKLIMMQLGGGGGGGGQSYEIQQISERVGIGCRGSLH